MQGYTDTIRKYASDTTRTGLIENADGTGEVGLSGAEIGRRLAVRFTLALDRGIVSSIRYQVFGCGFTIAACAAGAEIAEGLPLTDISRIDAWAINNLLEGLPDDRSYCADIAAQALQAAVASARNHAQPVEETNLAAADGEHEARIQPNDPLYMQLLASAAAADVDGRDRQMFAGILTVAVQEPWPLSEALGLDEDSLLSLIDLYFPGFDLSRLTGTTSEKKGNAPELYQEILLILLSHVPSDATGGMNQPAEWLARVIAARAAQPGHLWVAMGFFERPQLTTAIRRHLPTLARANNQGMRWKRYLFKQVCEMNGGVMCKSPNCGDCSDYALCFDE
ncbi:MAG: nitrogen fixation protein NifQ [Desulfuromonadales bacterium]|nr:nitrogen fixation protein NifQ [Desulfuromonadales bacterium]